MDIFITYTPALMQHGSFKILLIKFASNMSSYLQDGVQRAKRGTAGALNEIYSGFKVRMQGQANI